MPEPEKQGGKTMFRFDFPPGATSAQIAAAIQAARKKIMAEKAERERRKAEEKTDDPR